MPKKTESFEKNFQIIKQAVESLQSNDEVGIDQLLPLIDQATKAYNACKNRLNQIEKGLQESLSDEIQPKSKHAENL